MSYSFTITGATKQGAHHAANLAVDQYIKPQAAHACDIDAIRNALHNFIEALAEPTHGQTADGTGTTDEKIQVSCHGHCGGSWDQMERVRVTHSEMSVRASVVTVPNMASTAP